MQQSQSLDPDLFSPSARDARGRFVKGRSGNPSGRPRGIANPKRRRLNLATHPVSAPVLLRLLDRKPHLRRSILAQVFPPAPPRRRDFG
jgi:Family of unknown function (DUF5681)